MSVSGCPLIVSSLIRTRPSCCGSERGTVCLNSQRGPCPVLQLGLDLITSSDYVRLLGATITSDLNLNRHVSVVSASCFYWLRQLRRILGVRWIRSQQRHLYTRLLHHMMTIATPYWLVHQRSRLTSFKECSMLPASLPVPTSSTGVFVAAAAHRAALARHT